MAYRKSNGKMSRRSKKIEPAVLTMTFILPAGTPVQSHIDLSQCASIMNRRFYRQGINWAVAGFKVITPSGVTGSLSVLKLPSTWVMANAWEKSFRTWQRMNDEALEQNESIRPRFLDFKIYADATHHTAGASANLLPISGTAAVATAGEWKYSKLTMPSSSTTGNATDREFIAVGGSYPGAGATGLDAVSLIEGYAASRGLPPVTDPNVPADADDVGPAIVNPQNWMGSVFTDGNEQTEDVLDRMVGENNLAPYPFEGATVGGVTFSDTMYPNGANQLSGQDYFDSSFVSGTTIGGVTKMKGGMFPCGLITVTHNLTEPAEGAVLLQVDLVPGHHRGYLCEPMTDM